MPEGDTIFRAAAALHRALAGAIVTRFESVYPALTRINVDRPIVGRTIESVTARGKHLRMTFSGDLILHTHMRMNGSWHLYRPADRWRRPRGDMRALVATDEAVAVGFNVPVAELLSGRDLARHRELRALGPDLLDASFDRGEAVRRVREHEGEGIGEVLLNQRVLAGVGNVFKSEILFVAGIDPFTPIKMLDDEALGRVIAVAERLLKINVLDVHAAAGPAKAGHYQYSPAGLGRRTTGRMNAGEKLWVYSRGGQPCRKCGVPIRSKKTGIDARVTYWCPRCQVFDPPPLLRRHTR